MKKKEKKKKKEKEKKRDYVYFEHLKIVFFAL
jgi:hypothetical protein